MQCKSSNSEETRNTGNFINHYLYKSERNSFKTMYLVNLHVFENSVRIAKKEIISSQQLGMHNRIPLNGQLILLNPTL